MKIRATIACLCLLAPVAWADEASKAAKIAELTQLTGARQFLHEVDGKYDQEEAVRAWGRYYSENVTESDLDAILAYYRSPAGQKDVSASRAALGQVQRYMREKRAATAVATNTPAEAAEALPAGGEHIAQPGRVDSPQIASAGAPPTTTDTRPANARSATTDARLADARSATTDTRLADARSTTTDARPADARSTTTDARPADARSTTTDARPTITGGTNGGVGPTTSGATATEPGTNAWESAPRAPDGRVVPSPSSPERCQVSATAQAETHSSRGRSVVCVCTDPTGALTRDPVIAESSGDPRVDSGALKMARVDSGRYIPPTLQGQPQSACFRFAIDFSHHE